MKELEQTVLFADLCRSTQLYEEYGDVRAFEIVGRFLAAMAAAVEESGGTVVKTIGDEIMAVFPTPGSAAEAALAIHRVVDAGRDPTAERLDVKVGLNAGGTVQTEADVFGDAVNVAARLVSIAKPGQTVASQQTAEQVGKHIPRRELGTFELRGKERRIPVTELLATEQTQLTTWIPPGDRKHGATTAGLVLRFQRQEVYVTEASCPLRLGRDASSDVVIAHPDVSRSHATLHFSNGKFVVRDTSTNGTYLRVGSGPPTYLHRESAPLFDMGWISLGRPFHADDEELIMYRRVGPD